MKALLEIHQGAQFVKINIDRFSHISIKPQHVYLYFEATLPLRQLWIWNLQELEIESLVKVLIDKFINFQVVNNTGIEMILLRVVRVRRFLHIYIYIHIYLTQVMQVTQVNLMVFPQALE